MTCPPCLDHTTTCYHWVGWKVFPLFLCTAWLCSTVRKTLRACSRDQPLHFSDKQEHISLNWWLLTFCFSQNVCMTTVYITISHCWAIITVQRDFLVYNAVVYIIKITWIKSDNSVFYLINVINPFCETSVAGAPSVVGPLNFLNESSRFYIDKANSFSTLVVPCTASSVSSSPLCQTLGYPMNDNSQLDSICYVCCFVTSQKENLKMPRRTLQCVYFFLQYLVLSQ